MNLKFVEYNKINLEEKKRGDFIIQKKETVHNYIFKTERNNTVKFCASSEKNQFDHYHLEVTDVKPHILLSVAQFLIYEDHICDFTNTSKIFTSAMSVLQYDMEQLYEIKLVDTLFDYKKQDNNIDNFVYPICSKEELAIVINYISNLELVSGQSYNLPLYPDLEKKLNEIDDNKIKIAPENTIINEKNKENQKQAREILLENNKFTHNNRLNNW